MCEDFPCCGHENGCCPSFDSETGEQLDMKCVCGASLPLISRSSICKSCLRDPESEDSSEDYEYDSIEDREYDDDCFDCE